MNDNRQDVLQAVSQSPIVQPNPVLQPLIPQGVVPPSLPRLIISEEEWQAAEAFFKNPENKLKGKYSKKDPSRGIYNAAYEKGSSAIAAAKHSFLFINGKIYAVSNGEYRVGSGTFGNVKVIQDRKGNSDVVKIENYDDKEIAIEKKGGADREKEIGERVGMVKGTLVRHLEKLIQFKNKITEHKIYTVLEDRGKEELFDVINEGQLNTVQGLEIAIACCDQIQSLHDLRIVHCDIKPENFMASKEGDHYLISSIDFGFSKYLPAGSNYIITDNAEGTPGYAAPEVYSKMYSYATDVYALGKFFRYLGVNEKIAIGMTQSDPNRRMTLVAAKNQLIEQLRATPNLSTSAKELIEKYDQEISETEQLIGNCTKPDLNWQFSPDNSTSYVSIPLDFAEASEIKSKLPWPSHICEIIPIEQTSLFYMKINGEALREIQVNERKVIKFTALQAALFEKLSDSGMVVEFFNQSDSSAKGMNLNVSAPIDSIGKLFAIQSVLVDMNIPCKLVQNQASQTFTLVLLDNALDKIVDPESLADTIAKSKVDVERTQDFTNQYLTMQKAVEQLGRVCDLSAITFFAFDEGKNKGMHVSIRFPNYSERNYMLSEMRDLGLDPKMQGIKPLKLTFGQADLHKIANNLSIFQPMLPPTELPPLPPTPLNQVDEVTLPSRPAPLPPLPPLNQVDDVTLPSRPAPPPPLNQVEDVTLPPQQPRDQVVVHTDPLMGKHHLSAAITSLFSTLVTGKIDLKIVENPNGSLTASFDSQNCDVRALEHALKRLEVVPEANNRFSITIEKEALKGVLEKIKSNGFKYSVNSAKFSVEPNNDFIKECQLHALLKSSSTLLKSEYNNQRLNKANTKVGRWMLNNAKKAGGAVFSKAKDRNHQIDFLSHALNQIDKLENIDVIQRAKLANLVLDAVINQIERRTNMFDSGLKSLCIDKKSDLQNSFGTKILSPPNQVEAALLQKIRIDADVSVAAPSKKHKNA